MNCVTIIRNGETPQYVTSYANLRDALTELLGSVPKYKSTSIPGDWLVQLGPEHLAQLQASGFLEISSAHYQLRSGTPGAQPVPGADWAIGDTVRQRIRSRGETRYRNVRVLGRNGAWPETYVQLADRPELGGFWVPDAHLSQP